MTSTALIYELIVREKLPIQKVIVASSQATLGEGLYLDATGQSLLPALRRDADLSTGISDIRPPNPQVGSFEAAYASLPARNDGPCSRRWGGLDGRVLCVLRGEEGRVPEAVHVR